VALQSLTRPCRQQRQFDFARLDQSCLSALVEDSRSCDRYVIRLFPDKQQVWVQPSTAAGNVTLLAFAADRRAAAALLLQLSAGRAAIRACERSGERRNVRSPLTPVSITPLTAPLRSHAPAAIDRCLLPAGLTAANPPHAAAAVDSCGRQTDGQPTVK